MKKTAEPKACKTLKEFNDKIKIAHGFVNTGACNSKVLD